VVTTSDGKQAILSNEHVLHFKTNIDKRIWQPHYDSFTEISAGKLGRLRDGQVSDFPLPRANARPFAVTVDAANNVWYSDLSGWLGMVPAIAATGR
jgi:streptogramin lyase